MQVIIAYLGPNLVKTSVYAYSAVIYHCAIKVTDVLKTVSLKEILVPLNDEVLCSLMQQSSGDLLLQVKFGLARNADRHTKGKFLAIRQTYKTVGTGS